MFSKNIIFKNFHEKKINKSTKQDLKKLLSEKNIILDSLSTNYINSYSKKNISNSKNYKDIRVIGMGGSILGTEAIFDFLKTKIKKQFKFINNLESSKILKKKIIKV